MIKNKPLILLLTFLIPIITFAGSTNFWNVYNDQLKNNSNYQISLVNLKQAENNANSYSNFWEPMVNLGTQIPQITIDASGVKFPTMSFGVNFINLFGASVGMNFPFSISTDNWDVKWDDPNISISRKLFDESHSDSLLAKSNYYKSNWNLLSLKWNILQNTVKNIIDWSYYKNLQNDYKLKISVLKNLYNKEKDADKKENYYKMLISTKNSLLSCENSMMSLKNDIDYSDELYKNTVNEITTLTQYASETLDSTAVIKNRIDVKAAELEYTAYKEKTSLWFLPFIPNPTISLNLTWPDNKFHYSISVQLTYNIFNKGSNTLNSFSRKENENVYSIKLKDSIDSVKLNLKNLINSLKIASNNILLKEKDVSDSETDFNTNYDLYKKGFESYDEMLLHKIDHDISKIELQHLKNGVLLTKIQLLQIQGKKIGGDES